MDKVKTFKDFEFELPYFILLRSYRYYLAVNINNDFFIVHNKNKILSKY